MTFNDVLAVWTGLKGRTLSSIRKGAELRIVDVDHAHQRIIVEGASGMRSRSFAELERVWLALKQRRTVHVDSVLGGSGSSRNQPETLFANLPFVEWLLVDRKKHLMLQDTNTHAPGTLLEVDTIAAALVRSRSIGPLAPNGLEIVLPVSDLKETARVLQGLTGRSAVPESPGEYVYELGPITVRVVSESAVDSSLRGRSIIRARGLKSVPGSKQGQVVGRRGKVVAVSEQLAILDEDG